MLIKLIFLYNMLILLFNYKIVSFYKFAVAYRSRFIVGWFNCGPATGYGEKRFSSFITENNTEEF